MGHVIITSPPEGTVPGGIFATKFPESAKQFDCLPLFSNGIHVKHSPQNGVDGVFKFPSVALFCNIPHCARFYCGVQKTGGGVFAIDYDFYFGIKFVTLLDNADSGVAVAIQVHIGDKDFGKRFFFPAFFRFLHVIKKNVRFSLGRLLHDFNST